MKISFKKFHSGIKFLVLSTLITASLKGFAQQRAVTLDPKLGAISIMDLSGNLVNENYIQPGQVAKLVIPIASINQTEAIPKGSCKIKIGLGSKLTLDPSFSLNTVNSSNYFTWTLQNGGGQSQLTGELTAPLPANFQQVEVSFRVLGNLIGRSTITANFLITNHNTSTILSDNDGSNNTASLSYEVTNATAPVPVTVINELAKLDCSLKVTFSTDRELNLNNYEVEVSKNGIDFIKVFSVNASNLPSYSATIAIPADLQSPILYIRIKSITNSGRVSYTDTKTVSGLCVKKWMVGLYPNPVRENEEVTVKAISGQFDGTYTLLLVDMKGSIVDFRRIVLNGVSNFKYNVSKIAASKYSLKIANADGTQSAVLQLEKL